MRPQQAARAVGGYFKGIFYHELIPQLREQGKLVIVVSHDDRYFQIAGRALRLNAGALSELSREEIDF